MKYLILICHLLMQKKKKPLKILTLLLPLDLVFKELSYPLTSKQPHPGAAESGPHQLSHACLEP